ncbi:UDP-forming cellulose synthase catalytic subunit [Roseiarcaceae bacterium H3SJ34-1]|uniref:UDP-forming cellulose synthase catalytic subunit n=1 Tax=Terripilifer ovatus TaxID=3032367 RepID=UPI003AB93795|nr:UDP-forming cellulose synthase catalytic subunit [Roseiarcaceae bacterium H3SJ34-1]
MLPVLRTLTWLAAGTVAVLFLTQPISTDAQLTLGCSAIVVMSAIWKFGRGKLARQSFLALGTFVVMRYLYWRLTSTLPPVSDTLGFTLGTFLLCAEMYCVLILVISLIVNADPMQRKRLPRDDDDILPTVDVFIPSYNEDDYILATTIAAAMSMDYPKEKLKVWLLDDGGTDQKCNDSNPVKAEAARARRADLQALCAQMGAHYLTRARNEHAKAGNLNNGLKASRGEVVVVFDADHAPFRAFLRETVGHFARDPKLFLVQTPHVFLNPDPIEKNLQTFNRMPSENEMFYSVTQRGLDKWNGSFFCGSAALLRRTALDSVGGFSGVTITEDCETALDLHSSGWTSVFVDKPLIAGLQPETFVSFIGQRSRWAQGMFQILILKNPTMKKGLHMIQRLAYLSSMTFWFFPLPRLTFMLAPLSYIFFDVKIFVSNLDEAIAYTSTYIVINLMLQNYLYGSVRWPWISELYEYVQGVFLFKALVSVAMSPRKPTFNVTAKGLSLDNDHLSELAWPFFALHGLLVAGGLMATWRYVFEPGVSDLMLVVGAWNTFNMMIAGAALGAVAERKQPDRHPRLIVDRQGSLEILGQTYPVHVINVSAGGCGVIFTERTPSEHDVENNIGRLSIVPMGTIITDETLPVMLKHGTLNSDKVTTYGLEFADLNPREYFVLADLMYADSDALPRFLASRRSHKSILSGTYEFIYWGITEPFRALAYMRKQLKDSKEAVTIEATPEMSAEMLKKLIEMAKTGTPSADAAKTKSIETKAA